MNTAKSEIPIDYFLHTIEQQIARLNDFKDKNSDLYLLAVEVHCYGRWFVEASLLCDFDHFIEQELIQKVHSFFHQSILFCMSEKPQIGLSNARIAIEAGRDLLRILESTRNRDLYLKIDPSKDEIKEYRKTFRFSDEEKHLLEMYHFTSNFGIHYKTQVTDKVSEVKEFSGKNFKIYRQKEHSLEVTKILLGAQFNLIDDIWEKLAPYRKSNSSPEFLVYSDLFANKRLEIAPSILKNNEPRQLSSV